jgi:hypothetical protein
MSEKDPLGGGIAPELTQAKEIIEKLVELAERRGFGAEAHETTLGEKLPPPVKRPPNRPKVKGPKYRSALALRMASAFLRQPETRGARARFAREAVVRQAGGSPLSTESVKKRARHFQNEMSDLNEELALATYFVRRQDAGDSLEAIKATLNAALAGDDEAARKVFETVRDIVRKVASHRKSRK